MADSLITYLQIFGIGLSFALAGPCLAVCTPILLTYVTGREGKWPDVIMDITSFLSGRLSAYVVLGAIAGVSGLYLRRFAEAGLTPYLNIASGIISMILGILVMKSRRGIACPQKGPPVDRCGVGGVFALGFFIGISPCAPLTALLFEIALISRNVIDGAAYALSFALGTFVAGFIVVAGLTGILKGAAGKLARSQKAGLIFRICCAALLGLFGAGLIRSGIMTL